MDYSFYTDISDLFADQIRMLKEEIYLLKRQVRELEYRTNVAPIASRIDTTNPKTCTHSYKLGANSCSKCGHKTEPTPEWVWGMSEDKLPEVSKEELSYLNGTTTGILTTGSLFSETDLKDPTKTVVIKNLGTE